ncbi:MAG: amidohydrolase family protein [Calditrichaeota bacterium]|nr:amidohydrolase family protein [Calditrichota bacterium]
MGATAALPREVLLKGGTLYDPITRKSRKGDVAIKNGRLVEPGEIRSDKAKAIDARGCIITHGFIDIHAHFREPGREDKETLATGSQAALAGGFTRVCVMPNTDPPIDGPEGVRFILERSESLPVAIHPIGAVTRGQRGEELAELLEMRAAGAVAFSDDGVPIQDGQMLRRALYYARDLGVPVINHAEDVQLRAEGIMNEGALSTRLGLPGNPALAEAAVVYRDLLLAEDTGSRLHVPHVSTALAVGLVRRFKERGVAVTAEATPHHLGLTEAALRDFDTHAKVSPPLRSEDDRQAVVNGLMDGTLDCIATDHAPHTVEEKEQDLLQAPFGMIGLESAFGMAHTILRQAGLSTEQVIDLLTSGPARVMGLELTPLEPGQPAELVVLAPDEEWTFTRDDIHSRSRNTPLLGLTFTGRVRATISRGSWFTSR